MLIKKYCSVLNNINDYSYVQVDMILYLTILMNTQERRCHQLLKAAEFGYVGVVKTLIDKKYIDVESRNDVSNYIYVHHNNDVINNYIICITLLYCYSIMGPGIHVTFSRLIYSNRTVKHSVKMVY